MIKRRLGALVPVFAVVLAACSTGGGTASQSAGASAGAAPTLPVPSVVAAKDCKVGVSWNNYTEERWAKWDEPAIKATARGRRGAVHLERRQVLGRDADDQRRRT